MSSGVRECASPIRLLELRDWDGNFRTGVAGGRDPAGWHQALSQEIAAHPDAWNTRRCLPPRCAARRASRGSAPGTRAAPLRRALEAADRDRLTAAAGAILSDIRRLKAESSAAPDGETAAVYRRCARCPIPAHLFAVDGLGPCWLAGGSRRADRAAPATWQGSPDDSIAWRAPPLAGVAGVWRWRRWPV